MYWIIQTNTLQMASYNMIDSSYEFFTLKNIFSLLKIVRVAS